MSHIERCRIQGPRARAWGWKIYRAALWELRLILFSFSLSALGVLSFELQDVYYAFLPADCCTPMRPCISF